MGHEVINEAQVTQSVGNFGFKLEFEKAENLVGEKTKFRIIPFNPGLVYFRIRSCKIVNNLNSAQSYSLFKTNNLNPKNQKFCKDKITNFEIIKKFESKEIQEFQFDAFKWNTDQQNITYDLQCDIQLSYRIFEDNQNPTWCEA